MLNRLSEMLVTLLCWGYFILVFLLVFSPFYLAAALFSQQSEDAIQHLNRIFFRGFFALLRTIAPRQRWLIDPQLAKLRSSVVVCNHLSYLDPLLLIAYLPRAKTVVKPVFFQVPVFAWVLRRAGYFPATASGPLGQLIITQMATLRQYLQEGGNLFIFPQGTRRRDGAVGPLNPGAFKIARYCAAPVKVLCLHNTEKLFTPGHFLFHSSQPNTISLRLQRTIDGAGISTSQLGNEVHEVFEQCQQDSLH